MSRILSFQNEFKEKLLSGMKYSAMRVHKRPHEVGEIVQIYCPSPRSGYGNKLFDATIQTASKAIIFYELKNLNDLNASIFLDGCPVSLCRSDAILIAKSEGFSSIKAMFEFFWKKYHTGYLELTRYTFEKYSEKT